MRTKYVVMSALLLCLALMVSCKTAVLTNTEHDRHPIYHHPGKMGL